MVGGGVRHRGCVLGALYSIHGPPPSKEIGSIRALALWGYSHVGGGGARDRGCVLGALYSMHDQPPPSKEDWMHAGACTLGVFPFGWRRG